MALISLLFGDEICDPFLTMVNKCPILSIPTDWKETLEAHVFISDLPGLKKGEVKVEVDDERVLKIYGDRNNVEKDDKSMKWHRVERCIGEFHRSFKLPENAKTDGVKASMENGVLVVTVLKQQIKKSEKKQIEIEETKD